MGRKRKTKKRSNPSQDEKERLERLELRLKILRLAIEIPLVTTALIVGIDKILKL